MIRGLYTSAVGMNTQMNRMDVITNNIANADTTGFKKDVAVTHSFPEELAKRLGDQPFYGMNTGARNVGNMSMGAYVDFVHTDFTSGNYQKTDGTFDLTIQGNGFFAVNVTDNNGNVTEKYTRDGGFALSNERFLMTKEGNRVQGNSGDIQLEDLGANIAIGANGEIYVDGAYVDQIRVVDFENLETLRKYGDNFYDITDETVVTAFNGEVIQGFLESSNVNIVREMVDMITVSRVYEANSKAIQTHDSILQKSVEIGKK